MAFFTTKITGLRPFPFNYHSLPTQNIIEGNFFLLNSPFFQNVYIYFAKHVKRIKIIRKFVGSKKIGEK
jgi:chemotaxis methyl-accepting protein methylase